MPYEKHEQNIFADKIKKEAVFWYKILTIRSNYENLFSRLRTNKMKEDEILRLQEYHLLWVSIAELYGAIRYRYLLKLEEKKPEDYKKVNDILDRYRKIGSKINFMETGMVVEALQETCSMCRFDDVLMDMKDEEEVNIEEAFRE